MNQSDAGNKENQNTNGNSGIPTDVNTTMCDNSNPENSNQEAEGAVSTMPSAATTEVSSATTGNSSESPPDDDDA